jgi:putative ABC transport system substrate-binding protein
VRRRAFIKLVGAAATWPAAARAQQMRRIGVLMGYGERDPEAQTWVVAFRDGLRKLGWIQDRNIKIEVRWATPGKASSIDRGAKELVALRA